MKLGTLNINKAYLGSAEIIKAYLGSNLIFDNTQPGPTPSTSLGTAVTSGAHNKYYYTANVPNDLGTADSWEIKTRINPFTNVYNPQWIIGNNDGHYTGPQLFMKYDAQLASSGFRLGAYISSNGTSFDITNENEWVSGTILNYGKIYDVILGFNTTEGYYIKVKNIAGYEYIKEIISSSTNKVNCTSNVYFLDNVADDNLYFNGVQFFDYTTITINESMWFDGSTAVEGIDYINHDCVFNEATINNWYAYGSPTITDGIASGFSDVKYIRYFKEVGDTYETNLFIKTPNIFDSTYILGNHNSSPLLGFSSHSAGSYANLYAAKGSSTYHGTTQLQPNTDYIIKIISDGTNTKIYTIVNNGYTKDTLPELSNWTLEITTSSADWYRNMIIGGGASGSNFAGTIDLNNSCITSNIIEHTLPEGFTELTYARSDGSQLVDLGFNATLNSKVKLKINPQYIGESGILGQDWSLNGFFLMFYNNQLRWHSQGYVDVPVSIDTDYVIEASNGTLDVDGTSYTCTPSTSLSSAHSIELFGLSNSGTIKGKFKLYYLEWYENNVLTMKLIPVKNGFNSYVGLYDSVNHRVYYSTISNLLDS